MQTYLRLLRAEATPTTKLEIKPKLGYIYKPLKYV
jgi:hypothetical protein